ncbi:MAG: thiol:disulfide interchange protein DsbA/DsbL [Zoogloeaceae bacterium]|nr:thiol:disulfide interchange protein DsbA/DsbL [Zoogloeaceae bacterium]
MQDPNRRAFLSLSALLALGLFAPGTRAQGNAPYVQLAAPQPTQSPGKIEVLEFFSYGCPHCKEFHPILKRWLARQPASVAFRRVPVVWQGRVMWNNLAQFYYALEQMGDLARLDDAVFVAIHEQRQQLYDETRMSTWYVKQGGDSKKFSAAYKSFSVQSKVKQAERLAQDMKIESVPALIVEGRYLIQGDTLQSQVTNLDALIAQLQK